MFPSQRPDGDLAVGDARDLHAPVGCLQSVWRSFRYWRLFQPIHVPRALDVLGHVHTWCPHTVFFKDPTQYKAETLYSGTKVCVYILGTQCLNTALFCASAQALVRGYQLRTWPYAHSRKSQINPLISSGMPVRHRRVWVRDCLSPTVLCVWLLLFSSGHDTFRVLSLKVFTWSDCGNTRNSPKDQILTKPNRDGKDWRGLYASLRSCSLHRKWPRLEPTKLISSNLSGSTCRLFTDVPRAFQALLTNLETFWDSNKVAFPRFQKRASCSHVHQRFPQTNDVFLISCQVPMFFASLLGW